MPSGSRDLAGPAVVALVTGAARGMGADVAGRLAQEGVAIAALDVNSSRETVATVTATGVPAAEYDCDVRDWDEVERVVAEIEGRQGPIGVLASVAGVWESIPFLELDPQGWSRVVDVNLTGSFHIARAVAQRMVPRRSGSIVCVASNAAFMAWEGGAHYSASKAGLVGLVKGMALELGPHGIRVNAVCPGTVRTPANSDELDLPGVEAAQAAACPLGRIGAADDIAEAVAFLANAAKASWVTGTSLLVDGGFGTHGEGAEFGGHSISVVDDSKTVT